MEYIVQDSKYQAETISIIVSFSDVLSPGDTITGVPVVTVTVFTGVDASPSSILYQGTSIIGGTAVEQRIRLGVPGVIYQLTYVVQTVAGDTLEKECYLAILPDEDNAVPNWLPVWETTQLYPYHAGPEGVQSAIQWLAARLNNVFYPIPHEDMKSAVVWNGGTLIVSGIIYHNPHEDMQSFFTWSGGTLVIQSAIVYNNPHEDMKSAFAWLSGTLINTGLSYHNPHEDMKSAITWTGGTLA